MVTQQNQAPSSQSMGSTNTVFITETRFDPSYIKTSPGILKVTAIVLNLLSFICIQSSPFRMFGRGVYSSTVSHLGFWFSLVMLTLYLFHVVEKYHNIKWLKIEMISCVVLTFLNLTASTAAVAFGNAGFSAAGFFGYLAMVVYGVDAYTKAKALKAGELAQGQRVVNKQHTPSPNTIS